MAAYLHRQGMLVIPYLDDYLIHHPDVQGLLRHQSQLINIPNIVGLRLNEAKSELEPVQDIQFLGLRLHLDQGRTSLPVSKAREIMAHACRISSQKTSRTWRCPNLWDHLIGPQSHPTGSSTLEAPTTTLSFFRSDKLVFTTTAFRTSSLCHLTQAMAGPVVSHIRNPYPTFPAGVHHFHGHLDPGLGRPHAGFTNCGCMDPFQT